MISDGEKKKRAADIRALVDSPHYQSLALILEDVFRELRNSDVQGANEFETLKYVFEREGKLMIIKWLINVLENPDLVYGSES